MLRGPGRDQPHVVVQGSLAAGAGPEVQVQHPGDQGALPVAVEAKGDPYCTPASSARSEVRSFSTPGGCDAPPAPALVAPASGASGVALSPFFTWQAATGAGTYDLHLGTSDPPPLAKAGVAGTSLDAAAAGIVVD